jgi:hypothetical protein
MFQISQNYLNRGVTHSTSQGQISKGTQLLRAAVHSKHSSDVYIYQQVEAEQFSNSSTAFDALAAATPNGSSHLIRKFQSTS